jgi:quinoprotein glucose dehydrogenase
MSRVRADRMVRTICLLAVALVSIVSVSAQSGAKNSEWRSWAGDLASTRYAPLDQINADNFNSLEVAWRFRSESLGKNPDYNLQATVDVNGVLYSHGHAHRDAVAADATTGEMLWIPGRRPADRAPSGAASVLDRRSRRRTDLLREHRLSWSR